MKKLIILLMLCNCVFAGEVKLYQEMEQLNYLKEYKEKAYKCDHNIKFEDSVEFCKDYREEKILNNKCEHKIEFAGSEEYCSDYFYYKNTQADKYYYFNN